jgi:glutamate--cysteine ligase
MTGLTPSALLADLEANAFAAPAGGSLGPGRIGVETELIPVDSATGRRCPIEGDGPRPTLPFLRRPAARHGWRESRTPKDPPCFLLPAGGDLTFEPGGQLEYSSPPCRSPGALLSLLRSVVPPLRSAAADEGITLLALGIDPANPIEDAPLLLHSRRYARMAEYLERRGVAGARMMRQTASFQLSLDAGHERWLRWRVLNAAAPCFVAVFANSSVYEGAPTGCPSMRAQVWRALDPARTGLPWGRASVERYLEFALDGPALLLPAVNGEYLPFGEWLTRARVSIVDWHDHLTTLFPEVRPRGHFELRSPDAVAPEWYAAPLALAVGITGYPRALRAAADLLGEPDPALLERAGRLGLRDPVLARTASDLATIALEGCAALPSGYFPRSDLERAREFFNRYTRRERSPADELHASAVAV